MIQAFAHFPHWTCSTTPDPKKKGTPFAYQIVNAFGSTAIWDLPRVECNILGEMGVLPWSSYTCAKIMSLLRDRQLFCVKCSKWSLQFTLHSFATIYINVNHREHVVCPKHTVANKVRHIYIYMTLFCYLSIFLQY